MDITGDLAPLVFHLISDTFSLYRNVFPESFIQFQWLKNTLPLFQPDSIRVMGDKATARETMKKAGVPTVPGSEGLLQVKRFAFR